MADESAAECTVRHECRLDVFLDERQPRNIRILNTPHHLALWFITLAAYSGKHYVTLWRPSVRLSIYLYSVPSFFYKLNRERVVYST